MSNPTRALAQHQLAQDLVIFFKFKNLLKKKDFKFFSGTTPSTPNPISKSSSIASLKDEDDILDQLARQTSMALKGGKVPLEDDSTSSSDGATPAPGSVPSTYDVISLTF